ncbi:MAG: Flp pilus assembly complex ATPase component TadA [Planctomycetia bacterium]|nr:Flp pilus assembly complex ATPase component TadA [Planctomycetia bacterium]
MGVQVGPGPTAVETVERLLRRAVNLGASDLHLDPTEAGLVATVRRDGLLEPLETLPQDLHPRVLGRLKALADLLAYRTDVPQEGRIPADRSGIGREVRVATYPTVNGERAAVRLEVGAHAPRTLADLGLPPAVLADLARAFDQPEGVVLLTGPSGSGKTTTLYAALGHLLAGGRRRAIVTVEDPVERRVPGVSQTQIDAAAGLTFPRALRSLLRQDPDVLLVGEIRDRETAAVALEAGLTGHLVASTIHAGRAPLVFARLLDLGVEPFALTTAVRGVLAQRLVRRRAPDGTLAGRVLVAEWLPMSAPLRRAILARADGEALAAAAREAGAPSLDDAAADLVRRGLTTPEEVRRVLGD